MARLWWIIHKVRLKRCLSIFIFPFLTVSLHMKITHKEWLQPQHTDPHFPLLNNHISLLFCAVIGEGWGGDRERGVWGQKEEVGIFKPSLETKAPPEAGPLPGGSPSPRLRRSTFPTLTSGLICIPSCPCSRLFSGELLCIEAMAYRPVWERPRVCL